MKSIILSIIAIGLAFPVFSQGKTDFKSDKSWSLPAGKKAWFNLKFGSRVDIKGWNKNEVLLKTTLTTQPNLEKVHTMSVKDAADLLSVTTDYDMEMLKKMDLNNRCWSCDPDNKGWNDKPCICLEIRYELWLPYEAEVTVESINADVEIRDFRGPAKIKTINGFVDMDWAPSAGAELSFSSINGELYSDFDLKPNKGNTSYSKKLNSPVNGGGKKINLETINGNVYFRKKR